jgi:hypothetical protein
MNRKKILIVVAMVITPLLFAGLGYIVAKSRSTNSFSGLACGSGKGYQALAKGIAAFEAHNTTTLTEASDSIKALPNYQKDPNCMYIVTLGYIQANNSDEAKKALATFKGVYDAKKGLAVILGGNSVSVVDLEARITHLDASATSAKANTFGSKGPKK